jgi:hypothetical protein
MTQSQIFCRRSKSLSPSFPLTVALSHPCRPFYFSLFHTQYFFTSGRNAFFFLVQIRFLNEGHGLMGLRCCMYILSFKHLKHILDFTKFNMNIMPVVTSRNLCLFPTVGNNRMADTRIYDVVTSLLPNMRSRKQSERMMQHN